MKVAVVTPAGAVKHGQLDKTLTFLDKQNIEVVLGKNVYAQYENGYTYGGTIEQRLHDLQWAMDGDFDAIWTTRGGYGCAHLLQNINLRKFRKKPKYLIGYSDVTVLQSFLLNKGFASIHGQSIKTGSFGVSDESYKKIIGILSGQKPTYQVEPSEWNRSGQATGQLVGGNLSMIYSIFGSRYEFDFKDKILFIEEVGENYYALDRMLMNLELNGVFKKIKGLIVGGMTLMGEEKTNENYEDSFDTKAYEIVKQKIESYAFPVLFKMPNGHIFDNLPLIMGAEVKLKVGKENQLQF